MTPLHSAPLHSAPLHSAAVLASVGEFLLEGLYVNNRLSKFNNKGKTFFKR